MTPVRRPGRFVFVALSGGASDLGEVTPFGEAEGLTPILA
jgi:hypothetical protein